MLDLLIGTVFLHKNDEQKFFQACSLKHSIKKGMFYVQGKLNFFKSDRGESSPLPLATRLIYLLPDLLTYLLY